MTLAVVLRSLVDQPVLSGDPVVLPWVLQFVIAASVVLAAPPANQLHLADDQWSGESVHQLPQPLQVHPLPDDPAVVAPAAAYDELVDAP